ncbi:MAG: hypothetical protein J1F63_10575 [Oscillospiraceae bacterium]|nr:hypothetical protein [Oscillospiraceae bacterium]
MKKFIITLLALLALSVPAFALEATIPDFDVYIDSDKLEFKNADYPLLLYKDVTYFPMTYDYIHWLGLTSSWVEGEFSIAYYNCAQTYQPIGSQVWQMNPKSVTGELAAYNIYVNGKKIDNKAEEYPLFNYNGITYFPLTWRFATEEFGLDISWNGDLHIDKVYTNYYFPFQMVKDDKICFSFVTDDQVVNGDGSITHYNAQYHNAHFDTLTGKFGMGWPELDNSGGRDRSEAELDNGKLKYKGQTVADVSDFYGGNLLVFCDETKVGNTVIAEVTLYENNGGTMGAGSSHYRNKRYIAFAVRGDEITILDDLQGSGSFSAHAEEIGDNLYISLYRGVDTYRYELISLSPSGVVTHYVDADHANVELVGEINGRPVVRATWQLAYHDGLVSAVNDGFFIIEPDGSRRRIYRFVDSDSYFTANNKLYIAIERTGKLLDTSTGEEYDYLAWEIEQDRLMNK